MNNKELAGESVWNTYKDLALLFLGEVTDDDKKKRAKKLAQQGMKSQTRSDTGWRVPEKKPEEPKPEEPKPLSATRALKYGVVRPNPRQKGGR